jgi:RNA polymerase sigma factor (sigma-70 family)
MDALIGTTMFWVVCGLGLFTFIAIPLVRAAAMLVAVSNTAMRSIHAWMRGRPLGDPRERPLELTGLTPQLAALARQTRILRLELRYYAEGSIAYPDANESAPSWWSALVDIRGYEAHTAATRETWEWVRAVERLPSSDREQLANVGVSLDSARELLRTDLDAVAQLRALAGLVDAFDERIALLGQAGYRGASSRPHRAPAAAIVLDSADEEEDEDEDEDEDAVARERRRRWAQLVDAERLDLGRIAGAHARTRSEREDLEQEIALALWKALPSFREESSLRTFVHRIARYCHYRVLRRRSRMQIEPWADTVADASESAESWLARLEQHEELQRALDRLPDGSRGALALRLQGKSYAEIAETLGISEDNVSVRLVRAKRRIASELRVA